MVIFPKNLYLVVIIRPLQKLRITASAVTGCRFQALREELLSTLEQTRQRYGEPSYSLDLAHNFEIDEGQWIVLLTEILKKFPDCKAIKLSHNVIGETFILQVVSEVFFRGG